MSAEQLLSIIAVCTVIMTIIDIARWLSSFTSFK